MVEALEDLSSLLVDQLLPEQVCFMTQRELSLLIDAKVHHTTYLLLEVVICAWISTAPTEFLRSALVKRVAQDGAYGF